MKPSLHVVLAGAIDRPTLLHDFSAMTFEAIRAAFTTTAQTSPTTAMPLPPPRPAPRTSSKRKVARAASQAGREEASPAKGHRWPSLIRV